MREVITTAIGGDGKVRSFAAFWSSASPEIRKWLEPPLADLDPSAPVLLKVTWEWERGRQPQPVAMDLRSKDGSPITVTLIRNNIGSALEESRQELLQMVAVVSNFWESVGAQKAAAKARDIDDGSSRRGRTPKLQKDHPDLFEDVARYYVRHQLKGTPKIIRAVDEDLRRDPKYTALMENWGDKGDNRVRGWINRAKQMQLIPAKGMNDG